MVYIKLKQKLKKEIANCKKHRVILLIALVMLIFYIIFHYVPMYGVLIAFKDFKIMKGISGSPWVGFEHFRQLFGSYDFFRIFRNTILISLYNLIIGFPAPIILALMLNEIRNLRFKKIVQSISYLPHFLSWVIVAGLFMEVLSPDHGILNSFLIWVGIIDRPMFFLADNNWFRSILVGTSIWKDIGWGSIIYIASISAIDTSLYESAYLDGANRFQSTIHITIPSIMPVITIIFLMQIGKLLNTSFDQIFNMYNAAVYETADTFDTYVYRVGLEGFHYSYATAVGLFKNVVGLTLLVVTNKIVKRFSEYAIW